MLLFNFHLKLSEPRIVECWKWPELMESSDIIPDQFRYGLLFPDVFGDVAGTVVFGTFCTRMGLFLLCPLGAQ